MSWFLGLSDLKNSVPQVHQYLSDRVSQILIWKCTELLGNEEGKGAVVHSFLWSKREIKCCGFVGRDGPALVLNLFTNSLPEKAQGEWMSGGD